MLSRIYSNVSRKKGFITKDIPYLSLLPQLKNPSKKPPFSVHDVSSKLNEVYVV